MTINPVVVGLLCASDVAADADVTGSHPTPLPPPLLPLLKVSSMAGRDRRLVSSGRRDYRAPAGSRRPRPLDVGPAPGGPDGRTGRASARAATTTRV